MRAWSVMVAPVSVTARHNAESRSVVLRWICSGSKGMWSTWYLSGRDVFQRITVPARPLSADNIEGMLRAFAKDLEQNRDELAYRLGGKVA